ncbi:hypothetical protein AG1IA_10274 [Rhizoctonia solani AG-1 IA]|uniref:Uncharacterized protein n=1 Tax=Thanatephorus cucumeris (strain AG1-IA) TaxID=983506 RepID=L8WBZ0_THACA|nr:hypothetical protein AG1IA_10274 [Rhizoctonia solani AG-1 IA]
MSPNVEARQSTVSNFSQVSSYTRVTELAGFPTFDRIPRTMPNERLSNSIIRKENHHPQYSTFALQTCPPSHPSCLDPMEIRRVQDRENPPGCMRSVAPPPTRCDPPHRDIRRGRTRVPVPVSG